MRKIDFYVHTLTVLFGITSLANINAFLRSAGHDPVAAAVLSAALGAALIVVSIALTRIDWQTERGAFYALASVGTALAIISGALQSSEYSAHLHGAWPYLLGYGVPVIGEVGLSLAAALFTKAERRAELRAVNAKIEAAIISNLDAAIAAFDPAGIKKRIERSLNTIAARAVDGVTANLLSVYASTGSAATPGETADEPAPTTGQHEPDNPHNVRSPAELAAIRSDKKAKRMGLAWTLINQGNLSMGEIVERMGISEKTLGRYIKEFQGQGHMITVNGVVKAEGA